MDFKGPEIAQFNHAIVRKRLLDIAKDRINDQIDLIFLQIEFFGKMIDEFGSCQLFRQNRFFQTSPGRQRAGIDILLQGVDFFLHPPLFSRCCILVNESLVRRFPQVGTVSLVFDGGLVLVFSFNCGKNLFGGTFNLCRIHSITNPPLFALSITLLRGIGMFYAQIECLQNNMIGRYNNKNGCISQGQRKTRSFEISAVNCFFIVKPFQNPKYPLQWPLSDKKLPVEGYMGTLIFILTFVVCTIAWDLYGKARSFFSRARQLDFWNYFLKHMSHFSVWLARFYAGMNFIVESGIPLNALPPRFLLITNHQSLGDIATLVCAFPNHDLKYAAKKDLKWCIPSVSAGLRYGKHAFVNRKGGFSETMQSIKKLLSLPGEHVCPVIFPEGTRSRTGKLGRFHTAGVRLMLEHSSLPVVAAVVDGGYKVQKFSHFFTRMRGLHYRIKILAVYPHVDEKSAVQKLLDQIRSTMENQLEEWRVTT